MSIDKPPSSRIDKTRAVDAEPRSVRRHGVFTVASGLEAGRVLALPIDVVATFGRVPECTFSFDDESLSREHAVVIRAAGEYMLKDTSTNGSFVNDARLTAPTILRDGDRVQLGSNTLLRFAYVDDQEEAALRRVYEAAILDGLTGVFNRKHLEERIATELAFALRHDEPLSVIIFDVDHFKKVNDTYGHLAGDAVLKSVAALLKRTVRPEDVLARYGGEEFVILARATAAPAAVALADRLRADVAADAITFEGREIRVTSSAGVASLACCGEARDRSTLLGTADRRLYAAKQGGRNRVVGPG
ncbi:MAG: GGDEF domain-containing protein [Labilithrix sp.]|nr:GGDEF domain-containing protein [Labilithrix sp.]